MLGKMDCFGLTDRGRQRLTNEDQFLIADLNKSMRVHQTSLALDQQTRLYGGSQGKLLLVADGLGGHSPGERASAIAVDTLTRCLLNTTDWFFRLDTQREHEFLDELKDALRVCQQDVTAEAERVPERRGMGTTLTMAYLIWPALYVVHVGDSRCYLLRGPDLKQITRDHVLAQQSGNGSQPCDAESSKTELELGDTLLLCTDGLTKHVSDAEITRLLKSAESAESVAGRLIESANAAGGSDNVTVIVVRFLGGAQAEALDEAEAEWQDEAATGSLASTVIEAAGSADD